MHTDSFEEAFAAFLDGNDYDAAQDAVFALVRSAFAAGWLAAKKDMIHILPPTEENR